MPKRNDQPRERRPPPSVSQVHLQCVLCPALSCSLCAVLSKSTAAYDVICSYLTRAPNRLKHDENKKRGSADGFRGEPRCNETKTPLSVLEFRTVQRVLTGRLQPGPSTDTLTLPSS